MSAPDNGHAEGGTPEPAPAPRPSPAAKPPSGLPPASPGLTPPRSSGRRSMDGGSGRRSMDGGARRGRHMVEVPEGAERHEGLVVSRQEKVIDWLLLRPPARQLAHGCSLAAAACLHPASLHALARGRPPRLAAAGWGEMRPKAAPPQAAVAATAWRCAAHAAARPRLMATPRATSTPPPPPGLAVWLHQVQHPRGPLPPPSRKPRVDTCLECLSRLCSLASSSAAPTRAATSST